MVKVGIIGATGYAGNELVRILLGHKDVEIVWLGSRSYIDQNYSDVYRNMFKLVDAKCMDDNMEQLANEVDVIFTATPQGLCASLVNDDILSMPPNITTPTKAVRNVPVTTGETSKPTSNAPATALD